MFWPTAVAVLKFHRSPTSLSISSWHRITLPWRRTNQIISSFESLLLIERGQSWCKCLCVQQVENVPTWGIEECILILGSSFGLHMFTRHAIADTWCKCRSLKRQPLNSTMPCVVQIFTCRTAIAIHPYTLCNSMEHGGIARAGCSLMWTVNTQSNKGTSALH